MLKRKLLVLSIVLILPCTSHASVEITHVEFNPTQGNSAHEWIEIRNTAANPVSLKNWRLVVNGSPHLIKSVSGTTTIPTGATVILSHHPAIYQVDYPNYRGLIMLSAYTLPNNDGTVSLLNDIGQMVSTKSYVGATPVIVKKEKQAKTKSDSIAHTTLAKKSSKVQLKTHHNAPVSDESQSNADSVGSNAGGDGQSEWAATSSTDEVAAVTHAIPIKTPWWPYAAGISSLVLLVSGSLYYSKTKAKEEWEIIDSLE